MCGNDRDKKNKLGPVKSGKSDKMSTSVTTRAVVPCKRVNGNGRCQAIPFDVDAVCVVRYLAFPFSKFCLTEILTYQDRAHEQSFVPVRYDHVHPRGGILSWCTA